MTGRLINADAIEYSPLDDIYNRDVMVAFKESIENMPTVDAEPVRHGHWNGIEMDSRGYTDIFECSECKCYVRTPFMMKVMEYDFCPSCGAKMDAQEKDDDRKID